MDDLIGAVKKFLVDSGFEIGGEKGEFSFVAQNSMVLVFVIPAGENLTTTSRKALDLLTGPFLAKKFGPKTMDMFCIFVADKKIRLEEVEACEQDIRVCRKVVVQNQKELGSRLSFLRPLADVVAESQQDVGSLFWSELQRFLQNDEIAFLKKVQSGSAPPETLAGSVPEKQ